MVKLMDLCMGFVQQIGDKSAEDRAILGTKTSELLKKNEALRMSDLAEILC